MLDYGSEYAHYELFSAQLIKCNCCGKPFRLSSGVVTDEWHEVVATYIAYIPAPCQGREIVSVQLRWGQVDNDSAPEELTHSYEVWIEDGKTFVASMENGRKHTREVVTSFESEEDYDVIDFVVRANEDIARNLKKRRKRTT